MSKEAFMKHLSLDNKCERKPMDWSDLLERSLTREEAVIIKGLPVLHTLADDHKPMRDDLPEGTPQRFIALVRDKAYYVNTEGYSYVRYAFKLPKAVCARYNKKSMTDPKTTYVTRETFNEVYAELQSLKTQPKTLAVVSFDDVRKAANDSLLNDLHQLQSEAAELRTAGENLLAILENSVPATDFAEAKDKWVKVARN
jgi:hypothetical protein